LAQIEGTDTRAGDAAVVLVLKRLSDAERDGDIILAELHGASAETKSAPSLDARLGRAWAAGDLRDLCAHILTGTHGCNIDGKPWLSADNAEITVGRIDRFRLVPRPTAVSAIDSTQLYRFAADTPEALITRLEAGETHHTGPCRVAILAADPDTLANRSIAAKRHIVDGLPPGPGVFYQPRPIEGAVAAVYSGAGSAYAGMGESLLQNIPALGEGLAERHPKAADALSTPWPTDGQVPPLLRLWSASALCQVHAAFSQNWLGLKPSAVIGYSSGESNSLFATGIWTDLSAMISDARGAQLFTEEIGGRLNAVAREWGVDVDWETWTILAPVAEVQALVDAEPHLALSVIHSDNDCIIAGQADACRRVCGAVGKQRCLRLHYDLAVHVPALNQVREPWLDLHRRAVTPRPDVQVYSGGHGAAYTPTEEACAEAILAQANQTLDFRRVIEAAWADGIRIFVEHGPQASCSRWIRDILGDREALVVPLDRKGAGFTAPLEAAAALWVASLDLDLDALLDMLDHPKSEPNLSFKTHPHAIDLSTLPTDAPAMQTMPPAPSLAPVTGGHTAIETPRHPVVAPEPTPMAAAHHTSAPSMAAAPVVATPMAMATTNDPVADALRTHIIAISQSEQAHIAAATELHQRFLSMTASAMQFLDGAPVVAVPPPLVTSVAPVLTHPPAPAPTPAPKPAPVAVNTPAQSPQPKPKVALRPKVEAKTEASQRRIPSGPTFDRAQLEIHSSGHISEIFGPRFKVQDDFHRQVRMPENLLLLADRITGLDAELGSMGKGTIWSESDVTPDAWYLHQGHIPAGVMIESGQADLMLISYLGVDFTNKNDRVYRLLGCELTYHGGLPEIGDTLSHEIHMDGHATQGEVRLMFFHSDCRVGDDIRLSIRKGQAGFFTDAELADSDGCLWTPEEQELAPSPRLDGPAVVCNKSEFSATDIQAFADGRPWDCFGPGFERTMPHTRTPRIQDGRMTFLGPITDFSTTGGPWGRGTMKSTVDIDPKTWFFDGHFKNDPCMPGTLMFEGCLQLMAFYLSALGYTTRRDGWRFEPVSDMPFQLSCRGQVTPTSKRLTYELFVEEVHDGPVPTLVADLMCTVDGLKAFHARRVALQLVPGWPLDEGSPLLEDYQEPKSVAQAGDFPFDFRSLVACANGRPSEAFGPIYSRFDAPGRVARLPNPPYLFMSRITKTVGELGSMNDGMQVEVEYDIPTDAWYFDENGCRALPFAVLLEAALQPCGWLASYLGCALTTDTELCFRNLDGRGTLHVDLLPDAGTLVTRVKSTGISSVASMIIVNFEVECEVDGVRVYDLETVFGFFPQSALENQVGLPTTDKQRALLEAPSNQTVDFTLPVAAPQTGPRLAEPMLLMIDRVSHFDPKGGPAGLGAARAEKDVNPGEWFFKAHFFQDPVQPGSLGIEAMIQLLQWTMREMDLHQGIDNPRFETLGLGEEMIWKYRGQVIPENSLIQSTIEITEIRREEDSILVLCNASLWVDAKRIYEAEGLGMRIVSGGTPDTPTFILDPETDTWLEDHCPTWTVPALPMMSMVDALAAGACTADPVTALHDVRVKGWLAFDGPRTLKTERNGERVSLVAIDDEGQETEVATARVITGAYTARPEPLPPLEGEAMALPYETGSLFHGEAFQILTSLIQTAKGASSVLRAESGVPIGRVNPGLLDGATHGIPHDKLAMWHPEISPNRVAYPALIPELHFYGPTPTTGSLRCEVRPDGFLGSADFPAARIQLISDKGVWCSFRLVEACFDKGAIGSAPPADRRAFLRDGQHVDGVRTSTETDGVTHLSETEVSNIDWLPGTVAAIYGSRDLAEIAQREHIGAALGVHPRCVPDGLPLHRFELDVQRSDDAVQVTGDGSGSFDLSPVTDFWSSWFDRGSWPVEDLYYGLIERFVGKVVLTDPEAFSAVQGQSLMYLGNHQVGVESLLFSIIASGLGQVPTVTLAKAEHRHTWLGKLIAHCFTYPGVADPKVIAFFDREDKASLPAILTELAQEMTGPGRSVMVHIEGTRSFDCTTPVAKMSGAFLDMAMGVNAPVVPIRFVGALTREPLDKRLEFPTGMGRQDIYIGRPILPSELKGLHYGARKAKVLAAINALGPSNDDERPSAPDPVFSAKVAAWQETHGVSEEHAVLGCVLSERVTCSPETQSLLTATSPAEFGEGPVADWLAELGGRIGLSKPII
jgi:3-hydroxymyristoyl/3-hydroxydecanoyl-(acyl carrier protein) dehydratase